LQDNIVRFQNFKNKFQNFDSDNICTEELKEQLFEIIPNLFNYEEESQKLSFDILIIKDLDQLKQKLSNYLFKDILSVELSNLNLRKYIKSIAPFSVNGWNIFISYTSNNFIFGIYKDFGGIESLNIEIIMSNNFIKINKIDNDLLEFKNKTSSFYLHLSILDKDIKNNKKEYIKEFVDKCTCDIDDSKHKIKFKKNLANTLSFSFENIHGTIFIIQKADEEISDILKNGVYFKESIDLYNEYVKHSIDCSTDDLSIQKYYSITGILPVALNTDGIVIIDTKSRVIAYSVFIDNDTSSIDTNIVSGGARKRAAYSIAQRKIKNIVGIYYQSHDGDSEFKELSSGK
jgi:hypothetical protein